MNKKFIKVSLIICVPLILLLGFFNMVSSNEDIFDELEDSIEITYKDYKEEKYNYVVSVIVKNNSKNIASLFDMELSFDYNGPGESVGDFYIRGYEKDIWSEDKLLGIDPGNEKEIIFKIPKGIEINKDYYNLNRIIVGYNANFYKFRIGRNRLFLGAGQMGGSTTLGERY